MNKGKLIANEVWFMLPDNCKIIMKDIEKTFKESIEADVSSLITYPLSKKCRQCNGNGFYYNYCTFKASITANPIQNEIKLKCFVCDGTGFIKNNSFAEIIGKWPGDEKWQDIIKDLD